MPSGLTAYWIIPPFGPLGFGVTAHSLDDALSIIRIMGYETYLRDTDALQVIEGVTVADLDPQNVAPRIGPIVVRGLWYPFRIVGVPRTV